MRINEETETRLYALLLEPMRSLSSLDVGLWGEATFKNSARPERLARYAEHTHDRVSISAPHIHLPTK